MLPLRVPPGSPGVAGLAPAADPVLDAIQRRVLWLAVRMIHEANNVRPNADGLKVGGHQASCASVASILTALYFRWLRANDLVSIKPHAGPAYHAVRYLLGDLDAAWLPRLREYGGLQSYPSRTKDPDRVDFTTGSVGLGAVTPMFAALTDRYLRHQVASRSLVDRRYVAVIGDAELDEGNVWEAVLEESLAGLGNVTVIVDLNRQSLDRVVPGIRVRRLAPMFEAAGWQVASVKYGGRLEAAFARPGGDVLRTRIDDMSNEEYQSLVRSPWDGVRERLLAGTSGRDRDALDRSLGPTDDAGTAALLCDLGGHDIAAIVEALDAGDADRARPSILFAYTLKGWSLPFAGDSMNHSALLTDAQLPEVAAALGSDPDDPWARFPAGSAEARLCEERGAFLRAVGPRALPEPVEAPGELDVRIPPSASSQQAFGDALAAMARQPIGGRIVTTSPDVSVSTSLGGWINRAGVFAPEREPVFTESPGILAWRPAPTGRHIELGISEMNLFLLLGQLGLAHELFGETLVPIGALYDPFIVRGLDALVHGLYIGSKFVVVGTPSGVTLAPEGGSHQSTVTPSLGIELPGLRAYEPAFGQEVVWTLLEGIRGCLDRTDGFCTYLRLSTRHVDQALADPIRTRVGEAEWRRQALAGGYRLLAAAELDPRLEPDAPPVEVLATGAVVTEAVEAVRVLVREGVAANLVVVTSAERLAAELRGARMGAIGSGREIAPAHLSALIPPAERHAPIVTVADAASHALAFVGGAFGAPVVPLGVDAFGQSGSISDLYRSAGIDADHIVEAALHAIELA